MQRVEIRSSVNMKIEKIDTWLVSKWLTVRVTCDDGTYGVGEGNFWSYADATAVIAHRIEDDIRGLDPRDIDRIWNVAYRKYSFRSPAITAVQPEDIDAESIRKLIKNNFDILLAGGQDHLKGKIFRIGHLGFVNDRDIISVISALESTLDKMGKLKTPIGKGISKTISVLNNI